MLGEFGSIQESLVSQVEQWEERSLNVLRDSKIDQDFANAKARKSGCKKHKVRHMNRPMAIPLVILALQDDQCRESSLRCLSTYLLEKREEDPDNYYRTGCLLYNSCCTMTILLQEVVDFFRMMVDQSLSIRASKRLANVFTLLQCVAANKETRQKFVYSLIPNFMIPVLLFRNSMEVFENIRAVALSVIGILCQTREPNIIQWAVQSNIVEVCQTNIEFGNELSKVIAMHILEAILQVDVGISYICSSMNDFQLWKLMKTWEDLVTVLALDPDLSPRLLFHIIRCYVLLCNHVRGIRVVADYLPDVISDGSFDEVAGEFPVIGGLIQQLLVGVGKIDDYRVVALPRDLI